MKTTNFKTLKYGLLCLLLPLSGHAGDIVTDKSIGMELARDLADETIIACRGSGYHVSVVVVDRFGLMRAALRDDLASRFTLEIAQRKANMTVMTWTDSGDFRDARRDIQQELNHIQGLIVMEGGLKIVAGGYNIGAIGVSGTPGGEKDAACARTALNELNDRIEFSIDD
jgi:uncharacterized protein GlcG (DUF336 family)